MAGTVERMLERKFELDKEQARVVAAQAKSNLGFGKNVLFSKKLMDECQRVAEEMGYIKDGKPFKQGFIFRQINSTPVDSSHLVIEPTKSESPNSKIPTTSTVANNRQATLSSNSAAKTEESSSSDSNDDNDNDDDDDSSSAFSNSSGSSSSSSEEDNVKIRQVETKQEKTGTNPTTTAAAAAAPTTTTTTETTPQSAQVEAPPPQSQTQEEQNEEPPLPQSQTQEELNEEQPPTAQKETPQTPSIETEQREPTSTSKQLEEIPQTTSSSSSSSSSEKDLVLSLSSLMEETKETSQAEIPQPQQAIGIMESKSPDENSSSLECLSDRSQTCREDDVAAKEELGRSKGKEKKAKSPSPREKTEKSKKSKKKSKEKDKTKDKGKKKTKEKGKNKDKEKNRDEEDKGQDHRLLDKKRCGGSDRCLDAEKSNWTPHKSRSDRGLHELRDESEAGIEEKATPLSIFSRDGDEMVATQDTEKTRGPIRLFDGLILEQPLPILSDNAKMPSPNLLSSTKKFNNNHQRKHHSDDQILLSSSFRGIPSSTKPRKIRRASNASCRWDSMPSSAETTRIFQLDPRWSTQDSGSNSSTNSSGSIGGYGAAVPPTDNGTGGSLHHHQHPPLVQSFGQPILLATLPVRNDAVGSADLVGGLPPEDEKPASHHPVRSSSMPMLKPHRRGSMDNAENMNKCVEKLNGVITAAAAAATAAESARVAQVTKKETV